MTAVIKMSDRVLAIGAHCDDESFGCLGTLLKHKKAGDEISFLAFTQARNTKIGWDKVTTYFESVYWRFFDFRDQVLDSYRLTDLITSLESIIYIIKPTIVYIPFIGDLNKDHRIVAEATMVACRPYQPNAPKEIWMYQIPGTTELGFREFRKGRAVKIDKKLKESLIKKWYPAELINGRENIKEYEYFERWPR